MKKIVFISNTSWYIYNFRKTLLRDILNSSFNVIIIAPNDKYTKKLIDLGYEVYFWKLERSSLNPIKEFFSIVNLIYNLKKAKPHLIHNFTIKSCLYGTIAASFCNVNYVVNSITGFGHFFINNSLKIKIIRFFLNPILKLVFNSKSSYTIFQNKDDQNHFLDNGIISDRKRTFLIEGSGVDLEIFKPINDRNLEFRIPLKLLFPSRIIREKGIEEVLVAHESLIKNGQKVELIIAGEIDKGNRSSFRNKDKENMLFKENIKLLGHSSDMRNVYHQSDIVILPSWREGLSKSLIEAGAMEKPIITTDVPGCRDIIDHGINGILIPVKDPKAIESAILFLIKNNKIAHKFGKKIRLKVQKKFDVSIINGKTINLYRKLLANL